MINLNKLSKPIIALAPMHNVTNSEFRLKCRKAGADLVYSEMVSIEGIIRRIPAVMSKLEFTKEERPIVIQLFGSNVKSMVQAAQIVEKEYSPDVIDINFGCSVPKAKKQGFGAIQLKNLEGSKKMLSAVYKAVKTPLSIKMRLVSPNPQDTINFVREIAPFVKIVAIHGRTEQQKYLGQANWDPIYEVKKAFPNLIILGNGDIKTKKDFSDKLGNLDGVLIGRAARRNPEIFKELKKFDMKKPVLD